MTNNTCVRCHKPIQHDFNEYCETCANHIINKIAQTKKETIQEVARNLELNCEKWSFRQNNWNFKCNTAGTLSEWTCLKLDKEKFEALQRGEL